jgi:hypothetical protein
LDLKPETDLPTNLRPICLNCLERALFVLDALVSRDNQAGLDEVNQHVSRDVLGREDSLGAALWMGGNQFKRPTPRAREALVPGRLYSRCQAFANACMAASRMAS